MAEPPRTAPSPATSAPVGVLTPHEVRRAGLPLSCPQAAGTLWDSHPRVYLPIEAEGGRSQCPYCGTSYVLVD